MEDIKTKFRNLRTIFQREHKAVSSNKTCGSEDFYLPKWKHYRELMFLCESCDEDEPPEDKLFQEPRSSGLLQASPHPLQCLTTKPKAPPSPTPPDSQHSSPCSSPSPSTSSSRTDSRLSRRKRSSHRAAATNGEMLDFMKTICQSQVVSPHAGFLKYVEECLNETPPDKVKKLKKMIIETIHSVSEDESSAPSWGSSFVVSHTPGGDCCYSWLTLINHHILYTNTRSVWRKTLTYVGTGCWNWFGSFHLSTNPWLSFSFSSVFSQLHRLSLLFMLSVSQHQGWVQQHHMLKIQLLITV